MPRLTHVRSPKSIYQYKVGTNFIVDDDDYIYPAQPKTSKNLAFRNKPKIKCFNVGTQKDIEGLYDNEVMLAEAQKLF